MSNKARLGNGPMTTRFGVPWKREGREQGCTQERMHMVLNWGERGGGGAEIHFHSETSEGSRGREVIH